MSTLVRVGLIAICVLLILPRVSAHAAPPAQLAGQSAQSFRELERARAEIDLQKIDAELLSAAVFHETNRRREIKGLPPLRAMTKVREVAQMQAQIMAARGSISHVNPEVPGKRTSAERFQLAGLEPGFSAENVATAFGLNYQAGERVYVRVENGKKLFSHEPAGQPLKMHSYVSFAEALLDSWMASPGHRANILSEKPQFLGASCLPGKTASGIPTFYCAQEFFTPLAAPTR